MENEKLFSQAEVEEIIRKRLARGKIDNEELQQRESALTEREGKLNELQQQISVRESRIDCKSYLQDKGYPMDYADILDTSDPEAFKAKADKAFEISRTPAPVAPLGNPEMPTPTEDFAAKAFSPGFKHTPKEKY